MVRGMTNRVISMGKGLLVLCLALLSALASATTLTPENVSISWSPSASSNGESFAPQWDEFCRRLAERLVLGGGVLGDGVFAKAECVPMGGEPNDTPWRLKVKRREGDVRFTLERVFREEVASPAGNPKPRLRVVEGAVLTLSAGTSTMRGLMAKDVPELVGRRLLDSLPFAWWFDAKSVTADGEELRARVKDSNTKIALSLPSELAFFTLRFNERFRLWQPTLLGRGVGRSVQGGYLFSVPKGVIDAARGGGVWAQNWEGRSRAAQDYEFALARKYEKAAGVSSNAAQRLAKSFWNRGVRMNRLGLRLGSAAVLPGEELIREQRLVGVFGDMRQGPYAGWRVFADRVPEATASSGGARMSLASERYLLGFAVTLAPGMFLQQIDVTPRLGFWDMEARLPVGISPSTGANLLKTFAVTRAGSVGVEAGVEFGDGQNALRCWASMDRGLTLLNSDAAQASATRVGVDFFKPMWSLGKLGNTDVRLLGQVFGFYEIITLKQAPSGVSAADRAPSEVGYEDAFVGAGMGVTW